MSKIVTVTRNNVKYICYSSNGMLCVGASGDQIATPTNVSSNGDLLNMYLDDNADTADIYIDGTLLGSYAVTNASSVSNVAVQDGALSATIPDDCESYGIYIDGVFMDEKKYRV